jgi:hypothetical protein
VGEDVNSALELHSQKQTNARVYAERAERAIYGIGDSIFKDNITPVELYNAISSSPEFCEEESLVNLFFYLQDCRVFNTKDGLSFKELIESKDVVLIRCSNAKTNSIARSITQIVFTSLFESIGRRDKETGTQCVVVIDEFKFIMNTAIMDNLATIRDQKCTLIFNFQDISNFTTSPNQALKNPAYAQELLSNSHFIAVHNVSDPKLIRLIQSRCGKKSYDKQSEEDISNSGGGSETSTDRRWMKHTEYALTEDEIGSGEKRTAILLSSLLEGDGYARIHTNYINAEKCQFKITHKVNNENIFVAERKPSINAISESVDTNTSGIDNSKVSDSETYIDDYAKYDVINAELERINIDEDHHQK